MCLFRMIEQCLIVVNQSFHSAKKMFTADHGHSRRQFAVSIKRSCAKIETKKGTLDFTKMQDENGGYMEDFHHKLSNILRRIGLPTRFEKFRKLYVIQARDLALSRNSFARIIRLLIKVKIVETTHSI